MLGINPTLDIYKAGIRPLLFEGLKSDPEWLHQQTILFLSWLERNGDRPPARWIQAQLQHLFCLRDARLEQTRWGLRFPNPLGLAAGFDKDGVGTRIWANLGFGFAELGTVTFQAQPGNPRPRLFRLSADQAALNRMGFNSCGAAAMATRLAEPTTRGATRPIPVGINLGKSKITPLDEAAADYLASFRFLKDWGDYFVVNVSSPNTPGLRSLQMGPSLRSILDALQQENNLQKPIFVKIAPDLEWNEIADILEISKGANLAGIIATNTTLSREGLKTQSLPRRGVFHWHLPPLDIRQEAGGISGMPLRDRSTEVIRFIWQQTQGELPIIGVGGIFTAEDAWEKITAGASLVQVYTGWIYEGPWMVPRILQGLLQKLEEQGLTSISEAVGIGEERGKKWGSC